MINEFLRHVFSREESLTKTVKLLPGISLKFHYILKAGDYIYVRGIKNYLVFGNRSYYLKNNPLGITVFAYKGPKVKKEFSKWLDEKIYENRFKKMIYVNKMEKYLKDYIMNDSIPESIEEIENANVREFYIGDDFFGDDGW